MIDTGDDIFDILLKVVVEYEDIFNTKWQQEASYYIFRDDSIRPGEYKMYVLSNTAKEQTQI